MSARNVSNLAVSAERVSAVATEQRWQPRFLPLNLGYIHNPATKLSVRFLGRESPAMMEQEKARVRCSGLAIEQKTYFN
jgi:hypothetical protein